MADFNKGDISEGILAAAITARFVSKTKKISFQDVIVIIKKLGKPSKLRNFMLIEKEFDSPNKKFLLNTIPIKNYRTRINKKMTIKFYNLNKTLLYL